MNIIFTSRYGINKNGKRFIGYLYEDLDTKRMFSISHEVNGDVFYINEIDEEFNKYDNTYSSISVRSFNEAKRKISRFLEIGPIQ